MCMAVGLVRAGTLPRNLVRGTKVTLKVSLAEWAKLSRSIPWSGKKECIPGRHRLAAGWTHKCRHRDVKGEGSRSWSKIRWTLGKMDVARVKEGANVGTEESKQLVSTYQRGALSRSPHCNTHIVELGKWNLGKTGRWLNRAGSHSCTACSSHI